MIPFSPPRIDQKVLDEVNAALLSGWITTGPRTKLFEKRISAYCGCKTTVAVNSWTMGMEVFLRWWGIGPGDEVIIPAPYWVSYPDMVILAGGTPIILECNEKQGFKINPTELEKSITPKTKWIILNSPSNPTGACYTEKDIREIADILEKHPYVYILSDDIYEHVTYEGFKFFTIAQIDNLKDRVLTMNGVSKAYSMTGWRIGYAAGPKDIIKAIGKIQSQSTSNPSSILSLIHI